MTILLDRINESQGRQILLDRSRRVSSRTVLYLLLIVWAAVTLYPFVWMVLTSLKAPLEPFDNPFGLPRGWLFSNYREAWEAAKLGRLAVNSLYVTVTSTVMSMFLASTCAFVLARFNFRFKSLVWAFLMVAWLVPPSTRLVPLAIFSRKLGLYDNLLGLAMIHAATGIPFNVFFLSAFMVTLPRELEEAAIMDGASMWRVFWNVILPLTQPALVTMVTFHVLYVWNEFILALLLTHSPENWTLPMGMTVVRLAFANNLPAYAAAMVLTLIPSVVFFVLLQRYVVGGLTAGAVQGL